MHINFSNLITLQFPDYTIVNEDSLPCNFDFGELPDKISYDHSTDLAKPFNTDDFFNDETDLENHSLNTTAQLTQLTSQKILEGSNNNSPSLKNKTCTSLKDDDPILREVIKDYPVEKTKAGLHPVSYWRDIAEEIENRIKEQWGTSPLFFEEQYSRKWKTLSKQNPIDTTAPISLSSPKLPSSSSEKPVSKRQKVEVISSQLNSRLASTKPEKSNKRLPSHQWTEDEDTILIQVVQENPHSCWKDIAYLVSKLIREQFFLDSELSDRQCINRWQRINPNKNNRPISEKEIHLIIEEVLKVEKKGEKVKWDQIAKKVNRTSKILYQYTHQKDFQDQLAEARAKERRP